MAGKHRRGVMLVNLWTGFRNESAAVEANAGAIRDIVVRTLVAPLMFLFVYSGYAWAFAGSPQGVGVSSPRQSPSGQAGTVRSTKAGRTEDPGVPGPELSVKWEAGKLSVDAVGARLSEVLQELSHKTGIEVTGAQGLTKRVFTHFAEMDLLQALNQLLSNVDYAIPSTPPGSTSVQGIRLIILNGAADSGLPKSPLTAETNPLPAPEAQQPEPNAEAQESELVAKQEAADGASDSGPLVTTEPNTPAAPEAALQDPEANLQEPDAELQENKLAATQAAAIGGDREVLRKYLQDSDVAIQAAAFDALVGQGRDAAVEDLLANVKDTSQPTRLQALEILVQNGGADEQAVMAVLRDALKDPDPAFNAFAIQELAGQDNAAAAEALREALHSPYASTRLMVLESVVNTEAGLPLLREALTDSDETVSSAAAALLKQAEDRTSTAGKP